MALLNTKVPGLSRESLSTTSDCRPGVSRSSAGTAAHSASWWLGCTCTNPTHLAVALLYEHGETPLPLVLAKGAGLHAQAIVRDARAEGIPIIQHIPLARALVAQVEVDEPVPEHLFELVIDVLKAVKEVAPAERPRS
jgi:type III secretion system FlhB-like substrate exporter